MMKWLLLVATLLYVAYGQAPGVVSVLTQSGLNYASQEGLKALQQRLNGLVVTVPDQSGEKDSIEWTISSITITGFNLPDLLTQFTAGVGFTLSTSDISASLHAHWHAREKIWPHPSGSGDATVSLSSVSMNTEIRLGQANGRLTVSDMSTSVSIGHLDIHFSGSGLDWLLNLLKGLFEGSIKHSSEKGISDGITKAVNDQLNSMLQALPDIVPVNKLLEIDYAVVANEIVGNNYLSLPLKGEFYLISNPVEAPFSPTTLPSYVNGNGMLQLMISQYVPNTAFYTFWKAGLMTYTITPNMIPPSSPIQFNTTQWASLVPPLPVKYPDMLMQAVAVVIAAPAITINSSGIQLLLPSQAIIQVLPKNGKPVTAFALDIDVVADISVAITGNTLTGKLGFFNATFSLASSSIGPFDPTPLEQILLFGIDSVVGPMIQKYLTQGFPIPTADGVTLVNPTLGFALEYMSIWSNVQYTPPELL